jgi:hypothetical protein
MHLLCRRSCDLVSAEADVAVPEASRRVQVPSPAIVPDFDALASLDDKLTS